MPNLTATTNANRLVGYFSAQSSAIRNYHVADIPADQLTHVIHAFAGVSTSGKCVSSDAAKRSIGSTHSGRKIVHSKRCDFETQVPWELASGSGISIRAEDAWKISRGLPNVTIAIIDEGFDVRRLPPGSEVEIVSACKGAASSTGFSSAAHGARLSELIAGNKEGYPGVAPKCRLLLIELPSFCTESEEAYAFDLAYQFDAAAVCCAWGPAYRGTNVSRPMPSCVSASIERLALEGRGGLGTLVFFAAGNQGCDVGLDGYASHAMIMAVGGITRRGCSPRNKDFGDKIEIVAPISSPDGVIGGTPGHPTGNSGAAALVTGVAGLVFSVNPGLCASQVFEILKRTSAPPQAGVVDAGKAVLDSKKAIPLRARVPGKTIVATARLTSYSEKREFRERRYNGGEHSYFGLTAANMLQILYQQSSGDPQKTFFNTIFSPYTSSNISPSYSPAVTTQIQKFFVNNATSTMSIKYITSFPGVTTAFNPCVPFGYLVGLGADVYGSPIDMASALQSTIIDFLAEAVTGLNHLSQYIYFFRKEIATDFQYDDDFFITAFSAPDLYAAYILLAQKNYSHFSGHNLLFYLSYHLMAVNDAIKCSTATDPTATFNTALMKEAFALHFLSDMFSSGHARVPRWAFLSGKLSYGSAATPTTLQGGIIKGGNADLISKLIHDYEGKSGCLAMIAGGESLSQIYVWKNYGDGSLRFEGLSDPDSLIYFLDAPNKCITPVPKETIDWTSSMPPSLKPSGTLRRFDLITGLMSISITDVFRHMAQGVPIESSATGAGSSKGLLGYVLQRVPFTPPIKSFLSNVNITPEITDSIMKTLFVNSSGSPSIPDYTTIELTARLQANNFQDLFDVYQTIAWPIKKRASSPKYAKLPDFASQYCAGKFTVLPSTSNFETEWVNVQTANLTTAFGSSSNSGLSNVIPQILGNLADFGSTTYHPYTPDPITISQQWIAAVPPNLTEQFINSPNGVWGVEQ